MNLQLPSFLRSNLFLTAAVAAAFVTLAPAASARHLAHSKLRVAVHPTILKAAELPVAGAVPEADAEAPEAGTKYELKMRHSHTGEAIDVVYRIGNTYVPEALAKLNHFLRDSHNDDVSHYDPREFDVLHTVMARLGKSASEIEIVCGYRSPETNEALREGNTAATGVAEHSQHVLAKAIDIRVPGVQTRTLRDAALSVQAGGVGYYPVSQFVHVDVGPVRQWSFAPAAAHHHARVHRRA